MPLEGSPADEQARVLALTEEYVRGVHAGDSSGHDWWHVDRVWRLAVRLGREEGADDFVVQLAALLHDVADWKLTGRDYLNSEHPARLWLEGLGVAACGRGVVDQVVGIVESLSFKGAGVATPMATVEGRVVQDADRLDAIGAVGIARAFAFGGANGRQMHDPGEAPVLHGSGEQYRAARGTTVNHFHEKLLLLQGRMNTKAARRLAAERHRFMEEYLAEFAREWEGLA